MSTSLLVPALPDSHPTNDASASPVSARLRPGEAGMGDNAYSSYGYPADYGHIPDPQYAVNAQGQGQRPTAYQQQHTSAAYGSYYTPAPIPYSSHRAEAQMGQQYRRDALQAQMSNYQYDRVGRQYGMDESNARNPGPYSGNGLQHERPTTGGYEQEQALSFSYSEERSRLDTMPSENLASASMGGLQQYSWANSTARNAEPSPRHLAPYRTQPSSQHNRSDSYEQQQPQIRAGTQAPRRHTPQASRPHVQSDTTIPLNTSAGHDEQRSAPGMGNRSYQPSSYPQQMETTQSVRPEIISPPFAVDMTRENSTSFPYSRPQSVAPLREEQPQRELENLPLTVDPSQIFDQFKYDRRKRAAQQDAANAKQSLESRTIFPPAQVELRMRSDSHSRDDMAAEMRLMFEKMRELKSKDPTMFTEAWKTLRKETSRPSAQALPGKGGLPLPATPEIQQGTIPPETSTAGPTATDDAAHPPSPKFPKKFHEKRKFLAAGRQKPSNIGGPRAQSKGKISQSQALGVTTSAVEAPPRTVDAAKVLDAQMPTATSATDKQNAASDARGKIFWPEAKRMLLAGMAVKALASDPINNGKDVTQAEILDWLHLNPTHDELREKLSNKGFKFEKENFARRLLSPLSSDPGPSATAAQQTDSDALKRKREDVPGEAGPSKKTAAASLPTNASADRRILPTDTRAVNKGSAAQSVTFIEVQPSSETDSNAKSAKALVWDVQKDASKGFGKLKFTPADHPPKTTKEALARKTSFNAIVDLSRLSDEDDPPPHSFINSSDPAHLGPVLPLDPSLRGGDLQTLYQNLNFTTRPYAQLSSAQPDSSTSLDMAPKKLKGTDLCQSLDFAKAMRKSKYNPGTIARDFLIARGEHPNERPLNFHLDPLLDRLGLTYKSDLSTFRWDLVDPGGPSFEPSRPVERMREPPRLADILPSEELPLNRLEDQSPPRPEDQFAARWEYHLPPRAEHLTPRAEHLTPRAQHLPPRSQDQLPPGSIRATSASQPTSAMGVGFNPTSSERGRPRIRSSPASTGRTRPLPLGSIGATPASQPISSTAIGHHPLPPKKLGRSRLRDARINGPTGITHAEMQARKAREDAEHIGGGQSASGMKSALTGPGILNRGAFSTAQNNSVSASVAVNAPISSSQISIPIKEVSFTPLATPSSTALASSTHDAQLVTPPTDAMPPLSYGKWHGQPRRSDVAASGEILSHSMLRESSTGSASAAPQGVARRGRLRGSKNSPFAPRRPGRGGKITSTPVVNTRMPVDGVAVVIPTPSPSLDAPVSVSYVEKRLPPPAKQPKPGKGRATSLEHVPAADAYVSYKCRWIGCRAALHNLETLRKHILKVHRDKCYDEVSRAYSCYWGECAQFDQFPDAGSWAAHVQASHLQPLAEQLGDGPTTHPAAPHLAYLQDAHGNQIVPIAQTHGRPDPLPLHAGRGPTRAYHKVHGNITPEAKKRAERASLRHHALKAAEGYQGGEAVNRTAEWRTDQESSGSDASGNEEESESTSEDQEKMPDVI